MQFNLSTILALMLFLLTDTSLAGDGCYSGGTTWADLGDDAAISDAFNRLCDRMAGEYKLHDNIRNCINVNGHHIDAAIWPSSGDTHDYNHVTLSSGGCVDYMNQVKSRCPDHGGEIDNLETNPASDGGDYIKSLVMTDPEDGTKNQC
ncbi:hypothetical protein LA080_004194 [Diaporthe eres]|uniref:Secreted protein n=1 Tax=Diaporthe vaccinii TaxID=105482 RepID=A0ABR4EQD1_9PEZI|nr:hypothetical protein LA080_004194 [Diaporthe eres]